MAFKSWVGNPSGKKCCGGEDCLVCKDGHAGATITVALGGLVNWPPEHIPAEKNCEHCADLNREFVFDLDDGVFSDNGTTCDLIVTLDLVTINCGTIGSFTYTPFLTLNYNSIARTRRITFELVEPGVGVFAYKEEIDVDEPFDCATLDLNLDQGNPFVEVCDSTNITVHATAA